MHCMYLISVYFSFLTGDIVYQECLLESKKAKELVHNLFS